MEIFKILFVVGVAWGASLNTKQELVTNDARNLMQALDFAGVPPVTTSDGKTRTYKVKAVACFEATVNAIFPLYQCNKPDLAKNAAAAKLLFEALAKTIPNRLNVQSALIRTGPILCTFTAAAKDKTPTWRCSVETKLE